jgi:signal transduction histidine kinase
VDLPTECRIGSLAWLRNGEVLAIGTDTKGLFLYRRNAMRSLQCEIGSEGTNNVYFAQAPYGNDGVIASTRGIPRIFTAAGCEDVRPPIRGFDESAILLDHDQRYWYGREDSLFIFDLANSEERLVQTGLRPLCFLEHAGTVVIGTGKGIYTYADGKLTLTNPLNERDLAFRPTALCYTPGGKLWVATCSGVYQAVPNGGWEPVAGLEGICARALSVVDGGIFIGTYGSGAFLSKNGRLWHLPMDNEGFLSHVHAFLADSMGFLWMSTNQGLFRVKRTDLDQWTRDTTQSIYVAYYGKRSGIRNSEFNGGCSPAFTRTNNGWASFPTMDGLVWFKPEEIPDAFPKEPILLETLTEDGKPLERAAEIVLPWDHHEVALSFSLAYWGARENVKLEYSLDGGHAGKWMPMLPGQRELHLSTLPSGKTTLRIRKMGSAFREAGVPIELHFIVPVPFYRSSWFIIACILAGALILAAILRLNAARLRRRNLHLEKMVRARTSELMNSNAELRHSLEMKEMLVSIISHDIVTPLRFIARVSNGAANGLQTQDPKRLGDTLQDIARSSDKLHANAQGLLQWIKRQDGRIDLRIRNVAAHALVEEVLAMEQERAQEKGIGLLNEVPMDDVIRTDRNVLTIILHNLVANAVTHTTSGHVQVTGSLQGASYRITVADTGSGMPEAALRHALRVQGRGALGAMNEEGERDVQGLGLLIIADLLQLLGGSFSVHSEKNRGTTIDVTLPVQEKPVAPVRESAAIHSSPSAA